MRHPEIVLVEDDQNDQELIRLSLSELDIKHKLIIFQNGEAALQYLTDEGKEKRMKPELILMDLKLPIINGLDLLKELRTHEVTRHLPIVIFSSSKEEKDIKQSYNLGANAYVRKPIEFNELNLTLKSIGTFWLKHNCSVSSSES